MATVREKSNKLNNMMKNIEQNVSSAQDKCKSLRSSLQDMKQTCANALTCIKKETMERSYNSENLKYEQGWKLKVIQWEDSKKRDIKCLEQQLVCLKEIVYKEHPLPLPSQVSSRLMNKFIRQGFCLAVAGILGLTTAMVAFL